MIHALFYYAKLGNYIGHIGILFLFKFLLKIFYATHSIVLYVSPKLRISYLSPRMAGMTGEDQVVDVTKLFFVICSWLIHCYHYISTWPMAKLYSFWGLHTACSRENEVQTFISGSIG